MTPYFSFHQFITQDDFSPHVPPAHISKSWSHQWVQTTRGSSPSRSADDTPSWQVDFSSAITPWQVITVPEPILASAPRSCLCAGSANVLSGERVLHCRVSHRNTVCHRKAVFSFPYQQGSQLQPPALMQNVSRRDIKYLGWEAPALTKNTSMLAGFMRSASI